MDKPGRYFGLTGGVASGKSTVARMLQELGAKVIDADRVAHELLRSSSSAYQEIVRRFGSGILDASREIDRKRLGEIVFADPQKLRDLDSILHPKIIERIEELAAQLLAEGPEAVVVVDAALIFEAGIGGRFRKVLVAWCHAEQQLERLMAKAGISRQEAAQRIAAQMPAEEKRQRADYLIDCSGTKEKTWSEVQALYPELKRLVGQAR